jgi:hypothetical protein
VHFRVRKNVIQLIRTTYDATKKKGVGTTVGAVSITDPVLGDALRQAMTTDEVNEFEAWVATQHRCELLRSELAALELPVSMDEAEKWFAQQGNSPEARNVAAAIVFRWQTFRKRLAKEGLLD